MKRATMESSRIAAVVAILLVFLSASAQGTGGGSGRPGQHGPPGGHGQNPPGYNPPPGLGGPRGPRGPGGPGGPGGPRGPRGHSQCVAYPHEIECLHITLELLLKVAVSDYCAKHPELTSNAPWFDAFTHVTIPPESFTDTCLSLIGSIDIRESLTYCFQNGGQHNRTYVPTSPVQMYKDLCAESVVIQKQIST